MRVLPKEPYLSTLAPDIQDAVARNLAGTDFGRLKDWTSPLVPDKEDPTGGRVQIITEFSQWLFPTGYDWLDEREHDAIEHIGPMSIQLPYRERTDVIYDYFNQPDIHPDRGAWEYATEKLSRLVRFKLRPVQLETSYADMPTGTNLGLPYASADSEYRPLVLEMARFIRRTGYASQPDPAILYWRGQSKGLDLAPKQRTVWGYPHYLTLFELQLQIALLHVLRSKFEFAAWNPPMYVNQAVTTVMENCTYDILSVDFSRFDASVPEVVIRQIFNVMRGWFVESARPLIDYVEHAFLNIGLLTPEGILTDRRGGVPSGSGVTNLVDSLVQLFAFHYIAFRMRNEVEMHLVQGDDGVVCFRNRWRLEDVSDIALELNLKVSSDKGGVSSELVSFLQNVHYKGYSKNGVYPGVRSLGRVIGSAMSYERFRDRWSGADDSLRWIQQFEAARWHPKFARAIEFLYEHDRYLQKYTLAEIVDKAGGPDEATSVLDLEGFPYGKMPIRDYGHSAVWSEIARLKGRGWTRNAKGVG